MFSRVHTPTVSLLRFLLICAALFASAPASAQDTQATTVDLSASAEAEAVNDLARVEAYVEISGSDPAKVATQVNARIAKALEQLKRHPAVQVQTSQMNTWPVYAKDSRTITAWRIRSALSLESTDIPALSEVIGQLQPLLAVGQLNLMPSPKTLSQAEDAATLSAIEAFEQRARLVAGALERSYRIKALQIGSHNRAAPMFRAAMADSASMGSPAPVEAGHSQISVQVNGTIELTD